MDLKGLFRILMPLLNAGKLARYILLGLFSGLLSFFFVKLVTGITTSIIAGEYVRVDIRYIIVFTVVILSYIWIRRALALAITKLSLTFLWDIRKQILSLVLNARYHQLAARRIKVDTAMLNDVHTLMDAAIGIISFSTSAILGICCLVYMLSISFVLFLLTVFVAAAGAFFYHRSSDRNSEKFERSRKIEHRFQQQYRSILDGFKEVTMEPEKGKYIFENHISAIAAESYQNNIWAFTGFINNQVTGQVLFYFLLSTVLLFLSVTLGIRHGDTVAYVFTLLYLLGSIETIMVLLPGMVRAKVAADHLTALRKDLEQAIPGDPAPDRRMNGGEFRDILVRDLEFRYEGGEGAFCVGPLDFHVQRGEIVFIYGTNGSGKTTFLYSLLGLHIRTAGEIYVNGSQVKIDDYSFYKTAFAVVFSDFYLFQEILGAEMPDMRAWRKYVRMFELEEKVILDGRRLSTTDLSAGQRKRLALIGALMEKKPVLVLDEWAADQDPHFRKKFYLDILPALKEEGFTIIAITHDDKYYACADRLYRMDFGQLTPVHHTDLSYVPG
jgi:cyclic peptide transporter